VQQQIGNALLIGRRVERQLAFEQRDIDAALEVGVGLRLNTRVRRDEAELGPQLAEYPAE